MNKQKHTPEPWATDYRERSDGMFAQEVFDANGETIATLAWFSVDSGVGTTTNREENARRIVACVNSCAGIDTETLEQAISVGGVKMIKTPALDEIVRRARQRDELLAALDLCSRAMEGIEGPGFKEAKLAIAKAKGVRYE